MLNKQTDELFQDSCLRRAIKGASGYFGLTTEEQCEISGVKRATWYRRLKNPSEFTVGELRKMVKRYHWTNKTVGEFFGAKESKPWDI